MGKNFRLMARVRSKNESAVGRALHGLIANGKVRKADGEFVVEAVMKGNNAKELNRALLSALRKIEKRTTLRAEWASGGTTDRFFDYVLKKRVKV